MQEYQLTELEGGARVVSEALTGVRSISLGFWIGAGSRDEMPEQAGISHFLEHLLFKGTDRYSAADIAEIFDAMGAEANAFTSKEQTAVHARFLDENLERAFEVAADMVLRPAYREVDTEREVILEEIAMYEDEPQDKVHDIFGQAVFGRHALGRPVLGTADVIASVPVEAVAAYHDHRYVPSNIVVAAAGYVEHKTIVELVANELEGGGQSMRPARAADSPSGLAPRALFQRKDTDQYHVCVGGPGIAHNDDRRFALAILDSVLGGSVSSRLFQEIREKRGLAYSVYSFTNPYHDTGQIGIYVGTRAENLGEALRIIGSELEHLQDEPATEEELERAKEHFKGRFVLSMESTSTRMNRLGRSVLNEVEILSLDRIIEEIDAVDTNVLRSLARELYQPDSLSAAGIGENEDRFRDALTAVSQSLAAVP